MAGETLEAQGVIVATDPQEAYRLTGVQASREAVSSTYLYYGSTRRVDSEPRLLLHKDRGLVNNAHCSSNIGPGLAPPGCHLLSVTVLGNPDIDDDSLDGGVRKELSVLYGAEAAEGLELLHIDRISFAQFAQPPGFVHTLAGRATPMKNVLLASEATSMSSVQGAVESVERAAAAMLGDVDELSRSRGA